MVNFQRYSTLFRTKYDESEPSVDIGRGTHFSILNTVQWMDPDLKPMKIAKVQTIAVIWDEGHDTRIIPMLECALINGILSPVLYIGERKGSVTLIIREDSPLVTDSRFQQEWQHVCYGPDGDHWSLTIVPFGYDTSPLIHDDSLKTFMYLDRIDRLFGVGLEEYEYECILRDYWVDILNGRSDF